MGSSRRGCHLADAYFMETYSPTGDLHQWRIRPAHSKTILSWKWTSTFLLSTLSLPKVFENNLFPNYGEILFLVEKEWREWERKGSTAASQATSALIAARSWVNAEGLTATISIKGCSEGGYLTWLLKVISATAIWTKHLAIKLIQAYPPFSWEKCGKNPGREWMASRLMRNWEKKKKKEK